MLNGHYHVLTPAHGVSGNASFNVKHELPYLHVKRIHKFVKHVNTTNIVNNTNISGNATNNSDSGDLKDISIGVEGTSSYTGNIATNQSYMSLGSPVTVFNVKPEDLNSTVIMDANPATVSRTKPENLNHRVVLDDITINRDIKPMQTIPYFKNNIHDMPQFQGIKTPNLPTLNIMHRILGETPTTDFEFSLEEITNLATNMKKNLDDKKKVKPSGDVNDDCRVTSSQGLDLFTRAVLEINEGGSELFDVRPIKPLLYDKYENPANSVDSINSGKISKTEYLKIAKDIQNYIKEHNEAPTSVNRTIRGESFGFDNLVYMYTKILDHYRTDYELPESIWIDSWKDFQSPVCVNTKDPDTVKVIVKRSPTDVMIGSTSLSINFVVGLFALKGLVATHAVGWLPSAAKIALIGTVTTAIVLGVILVTEGLEAGGYHNRLAKWINNG